MKDIYIHCKSWVKQISNPISWTHLILKNYIEAKNWKEMAKRNNRGNFSACVVLHEYCYLTLKETEQYFVLKPQLHNSLVFSPFFPKWFATASDDLENSQSSMKEISLSAVLLSFFFSCSPTVFQWSFTDP